MPTNFQLGKRLLTSVFLRSCLCQALCGSALIWWLGLRLISLKTGEVIKHEMTENQSHYCFPTLNTLIITNYTLRYFSTISFWALDNAAMPVNTFERKSIYDREHQQEQPLGFLSQICLLICFQYVFVVTGFKDGRRYDCVFTSLNIPFEILLNVMQHFSKTMALTIF